MNSFLVSIKFLGKESKRSPKTPSFFTSSLILRRPRSFVVPSLARTSENQATSLLSDLLTLFLRLKKESIRFLKSYTIVIKVAH